MRKIVFVIGLLVLPFLSIAQELNCKVVVVSDKIVGANKQVFKTLEKSIADFVNQTKWTDKVYLPQEKIDCSILITLLDQPSNDYYTGSIQVQSSRPVFNSVYTSPVLNYKDEDLAFSYIEFEPLQFDENTFQSDLVSTLSFFAYLIIGMDADTFQLKGGDAYYDSCQKIVDQVQDANNKKAWKAGTNKFNRYQLINKLKTPSMGLFRTVLYSYHLKGLDVMFDDKRAGKNLIQESILSLGKLYQDSMSSQLLRLFMDAKTDEIVHVFSDGPQVDAKAIVNVLNRIAPTSASKWQDIK